MLAQMQRLSGWIRPSDRRPARGVIHRRKTIAHLRSTDLSNISEGRKRYVDGAERSWPRLSMMRLKGRVALIALGATIANAGCTRADQCRASDLAEITAAIHGAQRASEGGDYRRANELADVAITKIGHRYLSPNVTDDTGQRLSLADWRQKQGDIKTAADIRIRMADSRLEALRRKSGC